jgi:low temperature requirement protein LtrA
VKSRLATRSAPNPLDPWVGESILAATLSVQKALVDGESLAVLWPTIAGGLLIVFSMWWLYFYKPVHHLLDSLPHAFRWGYGHSIIFSAGAAVGAGLGVSVDYATHHAEIGHVGAGRAVAVPVAVFVLSLWFLHHEPGERELPFMGPLAAVLVLLTPFTGHAVLLSGLILSLLLAFRLLMVYRRGMVSRAPRTPQ